MPHITEQDAEQRESEFADDPQLFFYISLSDILETIQRYSFPVGTTEGQDFTGEQVQSQIDRLLERRAEIKSNILDAFGSFSWADHHWSDAVEYAVSKVLPDLIEPDEDETEDEEDQS